MKNVNNDPWLPHQADVVLEPHQKRRHGLLLLVDIVVDRRYQSVDPLANDQECHHVQSNKKRRYDFFCCLKSVLNIVQISPQTLVLFVVSTLLANVPSVPSCLLPAGVHAGSTEWETDPWWFRFPRWIS